MNNVEDDDEPPYAVATSAPIYIPEGRQMANLEKGSPEHEAFSAYAKLVGQKRDLETELKAIEQQLKTLEPQLLGYMGEGGFQLVRVAGFTISPRRDPWVYPRQGITRDTVCQALKSCGLGHYVRENFNTRSLTKYVHDLEEQHGVLANEEGAAAILLPAELAVVLEIKPSYHIQALRR